MDLVAINQQPTMSSREIAKSIGRSHDEVVSSLIDLVLWTGGPLDEMSTDDGLNVSRDYSLMVAAMFGKEEAFCALSDWLYLDALQERVGRLLAQKRQSEEASFVRDVCIAASACKRVNQGRFKTYFVHNPITGLIKIGKAMNPDERIRAIGYMAGVSLDCIAVLEMDIESEMHLRFSSIRVHGEWFSDDGQIRAYVAEIARGTA